MRRLPCLRALLVLVLLPTPARMAHADEPTATSPLPAPPPSAKEADASDAVGGPRALVHIESDRAVSLEARSVSGWTAVCAAPCDAPLALTETYRIGGPGVRTSASFALEARPGEQLVIHVDAGTTSSKVAGLSLIVAGAVAVTTAIGRIVAVAVGDYVLGQSFALSQGDVLYVTTAGVIGAAVAFAGVAVLRGGRTTLKQGPGAGGVGAFDGPGQRSGVGGGSWEAGVIPRSVGVPIFRASF